MVFQTHPPMLNWTSLPNVFLKTSNSERNAELNTMAYINFYFFSLEVFKTLLNKQQLRDKPIAKVVTFKISFSHLSKSVHFA